MDKKVNENYRDVTSRRQAIKIGATEHTNARLHEENDGKRERIWEKSIEKIRCKAYKDLDYGNGNNIVSRRTWKGKDGEAEIA